MTDEKIKKLVLGCGCFGGIGSAPEFFGISGENEEEAFEIMNAAWNIGIRHFDTADAYGGGRSETFIGNWMKLTHNEPFITSKTFNPMNTGDDSGLSYDRIVRQLKSSLVRLQRSHVDHYLAHEFDESTPLEDTVKAFIDLQASSSINHFGVSNFSSQQLLEFLAHSKPIAIQNSYSLLDRKAEKEIFKICSEYGIEFHAYSPLCGGWLTGKYKRQVTPENSRMNLRPQPYLHLDNDPVYEALDQLKEIADKHGVSMGAVSLSWLLQNNSVAKVVIGPRSVAQLEPVFESINLSLEKKDITELNKIFAFAINF